MLLEALHSTSSITQLVPTCYRHLALTYATHHKNMANPKRNGCGDDGYNFGKQGGITNGAAWYSVQGGRFIRTIH
jgi:hypothetical protein